MNVRMHQMCQHPRAGELFAKYAQLMSDVAKGLEPKQKLLS